MNQDLPAVLLYSVGPDEADAASPLLTGEAVSYLKNREAFAMAVVEEGEARGAICGRMSPDNGDVLEIISFYVAPAYRRRGLGGTLLMEFLEEIMSATDGSLRGITISFLSDMEGLESLLGKAGFRMEQDEEVLSWRVPVGDFTDSPLLKKRVRVPKGYSLRTLENLSNVSIHQLEEELTRNWVNDLNAEEMRQSLQQLSYVLLDQEDKPKACAIISAQAEKDIFLSQFFMKKGNMEAGLAVLQAAARAVLEQVSGDTMMEIPTLTKSSATLVKKMLPTSQSVGLVRGVLEV